MSTVSTADSLAATIEDQKDHPLAWKSVAKRAAMAVWTAVAQRECGRRPRRESAGKNHDSEQRNRKLLHSGNR